MEAGDSNAVCMLPCTVQWRSIAGGGAYYFIRTLRRLPLLFGLGIVLIMSSAFWAGIVKLLILLNVTSHRKFFELLPLFCLIGILYS